MKEAEIKAKLESAVSAIKKCLEKKKDTILISIEGSAASGKTTLAQGLGELLDCNIWHLDDYFLQADQRTEQRLSEVGGNVDYERFKEEIIDKVMEKKTVRFQKFNCKKMNLEDGKEVPFKRVNIMEGIYSSHPYFGDIYDLRIFMEISPEEQERRILSRNSGELAEKFFQIWIPKEQNYLQKFEVKNKANIIL